jgi:hypothetical protein
VAVVEVEVEFKLRVCRGEQRQHRDDVKPDCNLCAVNKLNIELGHVADAQR